MNTCKRFNDELPRLLVHPNDDLPFDPALLQPPVGLGQIVIKKNSTTAAPPGGTSVV